MKAQGPALSTGMGYVWTPLPFAGAFTVPVGIKGASLGAWCQETPASWLCADQLVAYGDLTQTDPGEDWFLPAPPFPGGGLFHAAARADARFPAWETEALAACSLGQRTPPGALLQARSHLEGRVLALSLLGGTTVGDYRSFAGRESATRWRAASSARVQSAGSSFSAAWTMDIGHAGLSPAVCLPEKETLRAQWKRVATFRGKLVCSAQMEARKEVSFSTAARRSEAATISAAVSLGWEPVTLRGLLSWTHAQGLRPGMVLELSPPGALRLQLDAGAAGVCVHLQYRDGKNGKEIGLRAGVENARPQLSLSWKAQSAPQP